MNPFDELAVEAAVQLKEAGVVARVVAMSVGGVSWAIFFLFPTEVTDIFGTRKQFQMAPQPKSADTLRTTALAMGADEAILVDTGADDAKGPHAPPLTVAKALLAVAKQEDASLVLLGKQSIDGDNAQTPALLAGLWGRPLAAAAETIAVNEAGDHVEVTKEVDSGLSTVNLALPAVVSCDLRLNEPRYATLPNIMKAKRKPLKTVSLADLGIDDDATPRIEQLGLESPPERAAGEVVASVDELLEKLLERGSIP